MKKTFLWLTAIWVSILLVNNLRAADISVAIEGRILAVEPSKSITVEIKKSKGIEFSLAEIKTLEVLDPRELTDGVGTAAAVGGAGGATAASVGAVSPPKSLQRSKWRDVGLVGAAIAILSATIRAGYNYMTQKLPMLIYDSENKALSNITVISQLPIGTRIRITQKNHINGAR